MSNMVTTCMLVIFVILTSYCDLTFKKIYNWLTVPFLVLGIITNIWISGLSGIYISVLGVIVGFVLLLIPFSRGWIGGGDVKLLAAAGAWIGPLLITYSTLCGLIFSGVAAFIYLLAKRKLKKFFSQLGYILFNLSVFRAKGNMEVSGKIPLGVFLGLGILVNWLYFNFYL